MKKVRTVELLSPARNLECGIEAIKHGADAVYIGAGRFGARQAAGNSVEDIAALAEFAHRFRARVYVTVNTILRDTELEDAEKLIWQLYEAGADALLVQDMGILRMKLPPIALHASTQCDVRSVEKVRFLASCGFTRVVLARELSLQEITEIHEACPDVELECFVHGALCVSYSGQCYASEHCFGRSANRGECAQFCRLAFDLLDVDGNVLAGGRHMLSLRDMNRLGSLEELLDAGVCSFKIEGRLKETSYVKNITAAYSAELDKVLGRRDEFARASSGHSVALFEPAVEKSFNRGFTDYFLHGRTDDIWHFETPKSMGEPMGKVRQCGPGWIAVAGFKAFHNGDGLCYIGADGTLHGYRVNRVEGNKVFLFLEGTGMPAIPTGTPLFRNQDHEFEKLLAKESAVRRIRVSALFAETSDGFELRFTDEDGVEASASVNWKKELARTPQTDNIRTQVSKLGTTCFETADVLVSLSDQWFVPSSILSDLRRQAVENLEAERKRLYERPMPSAQASADADCGTPHLTYLGNVMNAEARSFYMEHGASEVDNAYELEKPAGAVIMTCRHCIRYAMGQCRKHGGTADRTTEPAFLRSADGRTFRLRFDCARCQMLVISE